jgi:asparagine synthase (glutamine-hydrolysing)
LAWPVRRPGHRYPRSRQEFRQFWDARRPVELRAPGTTKENDHVCGIAGIFRFDSGKVCLDLVGQMAAQVRHRGPDALEIAVDGPVGLGHTRLSIIDIAGGRQPMHSGDGSLIVAFNGEIFNYRELREELRAKGRQFRTQSDTEVILHAYAEWGQECVHRFNGQWAFALWDKAARRLFLSRDRLGVRPLFYTEAGGKLLFGSEVKCLFADPQVERQLDPRGLDQLFTFWTTVAPTTVFQGVHELPPGHNMTVERGQVHVQPYWRLTYSPDENPRPADEYAEQLCELLTDATRLRLRADVPVGAYLSGGLDSSITTALARQITHNRLRTFSVTFSDRQFDESNYQRELTEFLGTEHQAFHCSAGAIANVFPDVVWHMEKPVLRTAPAPLYLLSQCVHDAGFKVVLTGEGADEMLGGYDIFKEAKVRRFCARQPDSAFRAALFGKLYPYLPHIQAQSIPYRLAFFRARPEDLASPFFSHLPRWSVTAQLKRLYSPELRAALGEHDVYEDVRGSLPDDYADWHPFCQAQYLETVLLMPGYILSSQGDRVSLAHAVEGRFPFLDHRVAEFAATIPPRLKMNGLAEKYILKRALGHLVPPSVAARTKQPYRAPDAESFFDFRTQAARADYVNDMLSPERIAHDGIFHPSAVGSLVRKVREGKALGNKDNMALVGVLSTQLVLERFVHNFPTTPPAATTMPEIRLATPVSLPAYQT